jgi:allantoicase
MATKSLSNISPVAYTGINEHEFANLSVGPNPANDHLNFNLGNVSADINIDIIDITGRIVISKVFKNVTQDVIDLATISNGSYVVRFTSESGTTHKNIIIAR